MNLVEKIEKLKIERIRRYPCYTNRASEIGHPCLRYLVYCRTQWQSRKIPSIEKALLFEEGRYQELRILQDLAEAGIRVVEQQMAFGHEPFFKKYEISGTIDGKIEIQKRRIPLEIKSFSPFTFQAINTIDDMIKSENFWFRKYPAQLTIYMVGSNVERGIFLLKNKSSGKLKQIDINLDYDFAIELLKKAELINQYIKEGQIPDRLNEESVCKDCDFAHICLPDRDFSKSLIFDMTEIKAMLDKRSELIQKKDELEEIDEQLKKTFEGKEDVIIGNEYRITGRWIETKEYKVPAKRYWKMKIERIK